MALPVDFLLSQASLQDWADCQRRFQLRVLQDLRWPAVEAEPVGAGELATRRGVLFHRLVLQFLLGIGVDALEATAAAADQSLADPDDPTALQRWWSAFRSDPPVEPGSRVFAELEMTAVLAGFRIGARFDAVVFAKQDRVLIFDWKTGGKRPPRSWLAQRLQTRVYPLVLVLAAGDLPRIDRVQPAQIEMVYWFAEDPGDPERFAYDQDQLQRDQRYLETTVRELAQIGSAPLPLTDREERCRFCSYRSLCGRGSVAGDRDAAVAIADPGDLNWILGPEEVEEIEF